MQPGKRLENRCFAIFKGCKSLLILRVRSQKMMPKRVLLGGLVLLLRAGKGLPQI